MIKFLFALLIGAGPLAADDGLVGHWPFVEDLQDATPSQRHLAGTDIRFVERDGVGCAEFNGRTSLARLDERIDWGTKPFSISVWVHTAEDLDDIPGDMLSSYDFEQRRGLNFSLVSAAGVTSSQPNARNVHFGIDDGQHDEQWIDHGRLGNAVLIFCMAVHDGSLFAGTCEAGEDESGRVFRFDGTDWHECGSPHPCNAVTSLAVHDGNLYAAVGKYRLRGSALSESENPHDGGVIYRYVADGKWENCGRLPETESIGALVSFAGDLYASSMYAPAGFFRYAGGQDWVACETPGGKRVEALSVHNGAMYATGYDEGTVYRYDGESWTDLGPLPEANQTYGFAVHRGTLYVSEWPHARVYRQVDDTWQSAGRLGMELESMPLLVYNGRMYAGSLPSAEVYRYEGDESWTQVARLDHTPDVRYRRVWSMALYRGRLFAGTLPSGHVHSVEFGRNVTHDRRLEPGWRHLTAVRDRGILRLFVDGQRVAESSSFDAASFDLADAGEFLVGFGAHDHFCGCLRDLRLYNRALTADDITTLARPD